MNYFGRCFVRFFSNFGYDQPIKATGRYFCDFLQSVDNIHLQMRFTYPKMRSPSMYITHIDSGGVVLVYRSSRTGFTQYFMGQLSQIADEIYNINLQIRILEETNSAAGSKSVLVKFRLDFDNVGYIASRMEKRSYLEKISLPDFHCFFLLKLFQFGVIFAEDMKILGVGEKLLSLWGFEHVLGNNITDHFRLRRPKGIPFTWKNVLYLQSVTFELEVVRSRPSVRCIKRRSSQEVRSVLLKGQMLHIKDINAVIFLCSPLINDLDELPGMELYLNDLNIHGLSREMVLTGWQHCSKLELMFERAEQRSLELENSYSLLDSWKRRGDDLLYSMIPQSVADRLRNGESRLSTCEAFDNVTILFCELAEFHTSSLHDAMEVVSSMNTIFSCFDSLMDLFHVYKVETVGRVYMAVSGAPERTFQHAENVANLALCLVQQNMISILGVHSGPVVGGVVGLKVPRYCLFGDTVNTAARMQTTSSPGKIHISRTTYENLDSRQYVTESRGTVDVKGKGLMETYWLLDKVRSKIDEVDSEGKKLILDHAIKKEEDGSKRP
ncbi:UNVERIFIED_CONTAM: hypothetical protein PYX00_002910 [Menopon gallinae]|uniref:guanylate cyclase n=1 Tax=Menopon gallinae TaxID=328185 RepID=A0AAW2HZB2_9NEOP